MGNIKALTIDELKYFNDRYDLKLIDNYIFVFCKDGSKKTYKAIDKSFILKTPMRKITITKQAIDYWKNKYKDNYTLIEVQNAINTLSLMYQQINDTQLTSQLKRTKSKYNNLI